MLERGMLVFFLSVSLLLLQVRAGIAKAAIIHYKQAAPCSLFTPHKEMGNIVQLPKLLPPPSASKVHPALCPLPAERWAT